ncbi:MAG: SMC-Scp complex subunit ScpB [Actinomycetota bacterium]|nr:SMC-Scp complex subunit ScpB [Actinomycetota bacterium]
MTYAAGGEEMPPSNKKIVEAILLLADEPVPSRMIGEVLELPRSQVEGLLEALRDEYHQAERGFVLRQAAGGWRLYTSADCAPWLERFVRSESHARLSGAALEVLAIIAYRQPLSRTEIAEIRGVESDGVVKNLLNRGLIAEYGRDGRPGGPILFEVSELFLERMGIDSVEQLPPLADFMPDTEAVEDMEAKLSPGI